LRYHMKSGQKENWREYLFWDQKQVDETSQKIIEEGIIQESWKLIKGKSWEGNYLLFVWRIRCKCWRHWTKSTSESLIYILLHVWEIKSEDDWRGVAEVNQELELTVRSIIFLRLRKTRQEKWTWRYRQRDNDVRDVKGVTRCQRCQRCQVKPVSDVKSNLTTCVLQGSPVFLIKKSRLLK
jgi:hypothetical protein